jgi:hypothetical protein
MHFAVSSGIDQFSPSGDQEPRFWLAWNTPTWPGLESSLERVGKCILGCGHITRPSRKKSE